MSKRVKLLILSVACLIVAVSVSVTYAFLVFDFQGEKYVNITTGGITFTYQEGANSLSLSNIQTLTDEEGISQGGYFDFDISLASEDSASLIYNIAIKEDANNTLDSKYVKLYLTDNNGNVVVGPVRASSLKKYSTITDQYLLHSDVIGQNMVDGSETHKYYLKFWLDDYYNESVSYSESGNSQTAVVGSDTFKFTVNVDTVGLVADTTAPVISSANVSTTESSTAKAVTVNATDSIGIVAYIITNTNTEPSLDDIRWEESNVTSWTSPAKYTNGTYYAWARDYNGNISNSKEFTVTNVNMAEPVCVFNSISSNSITVGDTTNIEVTCTSPNGFSDSLTSSSFVILKTGNAKAKITALEKTAVTNGYKYIVTLQATSKSGEIRLRIPEARLLDDTNKTNTIDYVSDIIKIN